MLNVDVGSDVLSAIMSLLLIITVILVYISYILSTIKGVIGSSEKIIEKHVIHGKRGEYNVDEEDGITDEERRRKIQEDIKLEEKWNNRKVESKTNGVGTENIVDGKKSLDAVNKLRKMHGDDNKE